MQATNNVVNLFAASAQAAAPAASRLTLLDSLADAGMFYEVEKRANLTHNNAGEVVATGQATIFNTTKNAPIAVMGEGYRVVQNREVFETFNRVLAKSGIDLEGAYIRASATESGSRACVEYIFPKIQTEVKKGDLVRFSLKVIHSFDGSTAFITSAQGFRLACLNGMVMAAGITCYKAKHSYQLDIDKAARIVVGAVELFMNNAEEWKRQSTTQVDDATAFKALAELSGFDDFALAATYDQYLAVVRPTLKRQPHIEKYMALWNDYKKELGSTLWALNNTMTHISTHGMQKGEASISYRMTKEAKVGELLRKYCQAA